MNLILLEPHEVRPGQPVILTGPRADHILHTLKCAPGSTIRMGLVNGPLGVATMLSVAEGRVEFDTQFERDIPPLPSVDLLLALPRPKVMRRLWAPLAAMGVGRIVLTNAWKVERNYFDTHVLEPDTYRPLLLEGLQQARDTRLPEVSVHRQFKKLIEDDLDGLSSAPIRLLADPAATHRIHDALSPHPPGRVLLAVGPEGGWTDYERDLLIRRHFLSVGMGQRVLRTDTACVALLALVHDALDSKIKSAIGNRHSAML